MMLMGVVLLLRDDLLEVGQAGTFDAVEFLELLSYKLKTERREVFREIIWYVSPPLIDDGVPIVPVVVFGVGKLVHDELVL